MHLRSTGAGQHPGGRDHHAAGDLWLSVTVIAQGQTVIPDLNTRTLVFNCRSDTVEIGLRNFPQTFSRLDHRDFIQVIFGSLHPDAVRLLKALFPPHIAALAPWDWF